MSTLAIWSAVGHWPEDLEEAPEFLDHQWVYLRSQAQGSNGKPLPDSCEWDRYVNWRPPSGDARCEWFGNESRTRGRFYCFEVGLISVCAEMNMNGQHIMNCSRHIVRSRPVD